MEEHRAALDEINTARGQTLALIDQEFDIQRTACDRAWEAHWTVAPLPPLEHPDIWKLEQAETGLLADEELSDYRERRELGRRIRASAYARIDAYDSLRLSIEERNSEDEGLLVNMGRPKISHNERRRLGELEDREDGKEHAAKKGVVDFDGYEKGEFTRLRAEEYRDRSEAREMDARLEERRKKRQVQAVEIEERYDTARKTIDQRKAPEGQGAMGT